MSDAPLGCFIALLCFGLILLSGFALVVATRARREVEALRAHLVELDGWIRRSLRPPRAPESSAGRPTVSVPESPLDIESDQTPARGEVATALPSTEARKAPAMRPHETAPSMVPTEGPRDATSDSPGPAAARAAGTRDWAGGHGERGAGRASEPSLEERLGARLPVWLGAIALTLAGAFLVQYSVDRGWLSPTVRVVLALLFGVALLAGGEAFRSRLGRIAPALSSAGVAVLYAALFAAVRLYELVPPWVGFVLMAGNTAVAVLLSLRQGPLPAVLGLVGGFLTPALVSSGRESLGSLVAYLFLLDLGLVSVTRRRRWPALAGAALAASLLWVAIWIAGSFRPGDGVVLGLFLLASTALFAGVAARSSQDGTRSWMSPGAARSIAFVAGAGGLGLLATVVHAADYSALELGMFALSGAGCLALARLEEEGWFALAPMAAGVTLVLLAIWGANADASMEARFLAAAAGATLLFAGAPYLVLHRSASSGAWGALAAGSWLGFPLVAALTVRRIEDRSWAALFAVLALGAVAAAVPVARRRASAASESITLALASLAAAATAALAIALAFALEREWLSVSLALEAYALFAIAGRLELPVLRRVAMALAGIAAVRLLLNPEVLRYPIGTTPIWNLLLWGYGVPAASLFGAARLARRQPVPSYAEVLEWGGVAFVAAGGTLEIWHVFAPEAPARALESVGLAAWSVQTLFWLLGGLLLLALRRRRAIGSAFVLGGPVAAGVGALVAIVVHGGIENPMYAGGSVGSLPVVNLLLVAYALPALLLLVAARWLERPPERGFAIGLRVAALALALLWATLEVRHLFRGADLASGSTTSAESFAYSVTWILFGTVLLVVGVARGTRGLRFAALSVMLIAVLKVFLVDASALTGLYRVVSFLGLGFSLLALAWLYQRFIFRRPEGAE